MAGEKGQKYYCIFDHEDGGGLEKISSLFNEIHLEVSIDEVFVSIFSDQHHQFHL